MCGGSGGCVAALPAGVINPFYSGIETLGRITGNESQPPSLGCARPSADSGCRRRRCCAAATCLAGLPPVE